MTALGLDIVMRVKSDKHDLVRRSCGENVSDLKYIYNGDERAQYLLNTDAD